MKKNFETGYTKNLAAGNLLIKYATDLGTLYAPATSSIQINELTTLYNQAFEANEQVIARNNATSNAISQRQKLFKAINPKITRVSALFHITDGVNNEDMQRLEAAKRKLRGSRSPNASKTKDPDAKKHSVSHLSFDQKANNFKVFISVLEGVPNYLPNEVEFQTDTLNDFRNQLLESTNVVAQESSQTATSRTIRDNCMYNNEVNFHDTFVKSKEYILAILPQTDPRRKLVSKLKFSKPNQ